MVKERLSIQESIKLALAVARGYKSIMDSLEGRTGPFQTREVTDLEIGFKRYQVGLNPKVREGFNGEIDEERVGRLLLKLRTDYDPLSPWDVPHFVYGNRKAV